MSNLMADIEALPLFQYEPLKHAENTRLCGLYPGSGDETLACSIHEIGPELEVYKYSALSYAWGTNDLPCALVCDGQRLPISQSLWSALRRLRNESKVGMLWVDAICIDQARTPDALRERASQVERLHSIFASAQQVIVDLGEAGEGSDILRSDLTLFRQFTPEKYGETLDSWSESDLTNIRYPAMDGPFWALFGRFCQRGWFQRPWCFQEFILAKEIAFLYGVDSYPEDFISNNVLSAFKLLIQLVEREELNIGDFSSFGNMMSLMVRTYHATRYRVDMRNSFRSTNSDGFDLVTLIHSTQWLKATVPQDRVYALIALTPQTSSPPFRVNYLETPEETASRLSLYVLQQCPLFLLYRCVGINSSQPSWSLSLEPRQIDHLNAHWEPGGPSPWYHAGAERACTVSFNSISESLELSVVHVGTTTAVSRPWNPLELDGGPINTTLSDVSWLKYWAHARELSSWIDAQSSVTQAGYTSSQFWQALVADMVTKNLTSYRSREFPEFARSMEAFRLFAFALPQENENTVGTGTQRTGVSVFQSPQQPAQNDQPDKEAWLYFTSLAIGMLRSLAITDTGMPCQVPRNTCPGDLLCVVPGAPMPMVLRPEAEHYLIVGCCYIHGVMDGQIFENEQEAPTLTTVSLR